MRNHGWQPPLHPLQVAAISMFIAMVLAFYVLLAPAIEFATVKYVVLSLYTPTVVLVFVLYTWCVVVNPADPGVLCSSMAFNTESRRETPMLYCTLCKVEILKNSRHCRSCDKCIDGFDHHCQWLNNCVGKRNYRAFFSLMVVTISMLVLLWVLGLWVLIRGFIHAKQFERTVARRLGSSFPFDAYSGALVFCTMLAMVATYPLGHLLIFHILLLQKGVSTHDFVVAVRDLEQIRATQDPHDSLGSVVSSGKASSSSYSSQGQGWCTPPRIVFDHEESIVQPEQFLSAANDVELAARSSGVESAKFPVKLSPWMLASMNRDDVLRSSMMSVSRSSIIRPALQKVDMSSKSGSDEDKDSKMAGVKETVGDHSTMAMNGNEVHSQQPPDLLKEPAGTEIFSVGCSRAQPEALIPSEGEAKTVGPRDNVLVYVLSSDGSGVSSRTLHVKKNQLDMLGGMWKSFPGWRWRQNPAFDAKLHNSAEYSGEVVSLPCTPRKSTSGLVLRQPSTGTS